MILRDRIAADLKKAMKESDVFRLGVLRLLTAAIHNREIEKHGAGTGEVDDDDIVAVLEKEAKKRKEAAELFRKGQRVDLAEKEERELKIVEEYLPAQASAGEIKEIIAALRAEGFSTFPLLMREAMKRLRGRAPGDVVASFVKESLE